MGVCRQARLARRYPLAQGFVNSFGQLLASSGNGSAAQLLAKNRVEGLGQLAGDCVVVADQQPLEEARLNCRRMVGVASR